MRYLPIPVQLFIDRRNDFVRRMSANAIAIFYSHDAMQRNGDQHFPFRQDSDLFALSGLHQQGTILVLHPSADDPALRTFAFILPQDHRFAVWNGKRYSRAEAKKISGIETIYATEQWEKIMRPIFNTIKTVYVNTNLTGVPDRAMTHNERKALEWRSKYPHLRFENAPNILQQMMMVKHPQELELMKKAIEVTGIAFNRVLQSISPGMKEYEVEASITDVLIRQGCQHAFEPIVASGLSACTLHYVRNDATIRPGSLVLLDFGAEYACMASDMSRTIPASGRFTTRQLDIYRSVLRVLYATTDLMRPGITLAQLNEETGKMIDAELIRLKLLTRQDIRRQSAAHPLRRKYFMHGVSHHLGYDVHDKHLREAVIRPGMVLTCEPGLYIREEKTGIRLENDILVTRGKPKNLMAHIPIEPEEIESLMVR